MKKIISILLALCFIFATVQCAFAAEPTEEENIMIDGTWSVLVPKNYAENESYSIKTLRSKLSEVLGVDLPIVYKAESKFVALNIDYDGMADIEANGYSIKADGDKVYINGSGVRGMLYGVNRFLEEFCGYRVYTHDLTVLPTADYISVPADTDIVYAPYFEYTETDWVSPSHWVYSAVNGLTGGNYRRLPDYMGGTVDYIAGLAHTFTTRFCSADKYFEEHPEYFAYRDGERTKDQLCLSNPETLEIVKSEVLDLLKTQHDPSASLQIVSLTQNDNMNYCQCDECKAFEEAHGGVQSATMINFVNQVADAVKAAGYDNVAIDTFAYQYTRKAPTNIAPRDNMIVRLCTIECCFSHTLDDPDCKENAELMADLEAWSKICNRIYIWDYTTNYAHTCCLFPDFDVIQKNIQIFYEHNVKGVYEEGNYYMSSCDTEFGELRSYMISKCLQNPYCDLEKEVDGFLKAYYGDGGEYIGKALKLCCDNAGDSDGHLKIYQSSKESMTLKPYQVAQIDLYFEKAKDGAKTDEQLENIERSELSWRYWKACANRGEFCFINPSRYDEREKLFNDIIASGAVRMSEGQEANDYVYCPSVRYIIPDNWANYEEGESGATATNFFGKILEFITSATPILGTLYAIFTNTMSGNSQIDRA